MDKEHSKRKLSGILSADVVGYSRLMQENEDFTIKSLGESKKFIGDIIEEYKGRVVDAPGDNILAEFSSVVNAVDCAVKIQDKLQQTNALLPEKNRMNFRIGVNLGDVIDEDGKIYGDGVNIAARIEGLAKPGTVCISRTAYDQVKSKFKFGYEYLGEHNLKNISEPVSVYRVLTGEDNAGKVIGEKKFLKDNFQKLAMTVITVLFLVAAGAIGYIIQTRQSLETVPEQQAEIAKQVQPSEKNELPQQAGEIEQKQPSEKNEQPLQSGKIEQTSFNNMTFPMINITSIAVLPFDNLSNDMSRDNFSVSLRDEVALTLSKHPDLWVTSRYSSLEGENTQQSRENSGIRYILKGNVKWEGSKVRITVQLVETTLGYIIWNGDYDREINNNGLAIQDEIKWRIFREIRIRLVDRNQTPAFIPDYRSNIEYIEKFHLLYRYYKTMPFDPGRLENLKMANDLADELISIKPDPWVYYMKGSILIALGDNNDNKSESPETVAMEAEKLNKGAGLGIMGQIYLTKFERLKAKDDLEKALDYYQQWIEFDPDSYNAHFGEGYIYLLDKRYDEAVDQYEIGIKINPNPEIQNFLLLGIAYSRPSEKGFSNLEKAIFNISKAVAPPNQNNFQAQQLLTLLYAFGGQMEQARFHAQEMLRIQPFFSLKYYQYRSWPLPDEATDNTITSFYKELLKKAGIPESSEDFMPQAR